MLGKVCQHCGLCWLIPQFPRPRKDHPRKRKTMVPPPCRFFHSFQGNGSSRLPQLSTCSTTGHLPSHSGTLWQDAAQQFACRRAEKKAMLGWASPPCPHYVWKPPAEGTRGKAPAQLLAVNLGSGRTHMQNTLRPIRYHRIHKPRSINVIICEPAPGEFVWLSMCLRPDLRNRRLCKEIVRHIVRQLGGRHYVHFFPEITTLRQLAREDGWRYQGRSRFFHHCVAYEAKPPPDEPAITPLLRSILTHCTTSRRPRLPTFRNSKSASRALRKIGRQFAIDHRLSCK